MILEVRYKNNNSWSDLKSVHISFPERYTLEDIVNRIIKKSYLELAFPVFFHEDRIYYVSYNSFKKDFKDFLKTEFNINAENFVGIRRFDIPDAVPFISK